jgi:mannose-6-phosphate isomerase-like protein (cupin superfamily)
MFHKAIFGMAASAIGLLAQAPLPGNFTFVPRADIENVQKSIDNGFPNDAPVRTVNIANKFNLGVYTLNSRPNKPPAPGTPVMGFYHKDIAELYYVVSGTGTWRVGGELENPAEDDPNGRADKEIRGPSVGGVLKGFTDQKITAGDVLIVPPGVPHSPGTMSETTKIIRIVIDPKRVLPLHPAEPGSSAPARIPAAGASGKPPAKLPGTFTFIPKAEIDKTLKAIEAPGAYGDQAVRTVDLANMNYRLGVYVLHAVKPSENTPASGWYHTEIAELYYVMRGAGTFLIGGSLENPMPDDPNSYSTKMVRGPSVSGKFKGATEQKIEAGDVLIAPIGVPHTPGRTTAAPRDIMRIAIDPAKVLPLK